MKFSKWIWMFLLLPMMAGLGWLDMNLAMPELAHRVVELGILFLVYGLAYLWVGRNEAALIDPRRKVRKPAVAKEPMRWSIEVELPADEAGLQQASSFRDEQRRLEENYYLN